MVRLSANSERALLDSTEVEFLVRSTSLPDFAENWGVAGQVLEAVNKSLVGLIYRGASPDFCHVLFHIDGGALLSEAVKVNEALYEVDRGCDGEPAALRLVGVKNRVGVNDEPQALNRSCREDLGVQEYVSSGEIRRVNAVADDGKEVFFTSGVEAGCVVHQLFVRLGGERTLESLAG